MSEFVLYRCPGIDDPQPVVAVPEEAPAGVSEAEATPVPNEQVNPVEVQVQEALTPPQSDEATSESSG